MKPIRLIELEPKKLRYEERIEEGKKQVYYVEVGEKEWAHGICFLCPLCYEKNKGKIGTHQIICWSKNAGTPDYAKPGPGRWSFDGTGWHDLTLNGENGKSRSILLKGGCCWHGFITNGVVT